MNVPKFCFYTSLGAGIWVVVLAVVGYVVGNNIELIKSNLQPITYITLCLLTVIVVVYVIWHKKGEGMRQYLKFFLLSILLLTLTVSAHANIKTYRVKWGGETLYSLLSDKFSPQEIFDINKELKRLVPDFTLKKGTLVKESSTSITLMPNFLTDISINKIEDDFELDVVKHQVYTVNSVVQGDIESSLIAAINEAGEDTELAFMLAAIYEWEIDFFHALRKGDHFRLLVEKKNLLRISS